VCITHAPFDPSSPADVEAARRTMFEPDLGKGEWSLWNNSWWMDPVMTGAYPDVFDSLGADAPQIVDGDMGLIHQPLDFVGINIYHCERIRATPSGGAEVVPLRPGEGMTLMGWDITPEALYWGPKFLHEKYGTPMFITENGMACHDWVSVDGEVHDPSRIDFITRYLTQLRQAVSEGLPVQGYLYWSALDNFEWERGYAQRFGLIHVDFETQVRTLKDSAKWYRELIRTGGETLPSEPSRL
ncbi:MAG: family 1 glycosylhydrolase, partial [Myxococcota bacterium]